MTRIGDKAIKALRETKAKQWRGKLQYDGCYCAMGVLCLAYEAETGKELCRLNTGRGPELAGSAVHLYDEVIQHYGLTKRGVRSIEVRNDTNGLSFVEIAKVMEENRENFFYEGC